MLPKEGLKEKERFYKHENLRKLSLKFKLSEAVLDFIFEHAPNLKILEFYGTNILPYGLVSSMNRLSHLKEFVIGTSEYRYDYSESNLGEEIGSASWLLQIEVLSVREAHIMEGLNGKCLPKLKCLKLRGSCGVSEEWKIEAPNLETFHVSNYFLEKEAIPGLLQGMPLVKDLDLGGNNLCKKGAFVIQTGSSLQSLSLAQNDVQDDHLKILFSHTPSFQGLKHLNLTQNYLTSQGVRILIDTLSQDGQPLEFESLDLGSSFNKKPDHECVDILIEKCKVLPKLKKLYLRPEAAGGDDGLKRLKKAFPQTQVLTSYTLKETD